MLAVKVFARTAIACFIMASCVSPASARYLQADPIGLQGGNNPYLYADANPVDTIDPDGLVGRNPKGHYRLVACPRMELTECTSRCAMRGGVKSCMVTRGSRSVIIGGNVTHEPYTVAGSMSCVCNDDDKPNCPPESKSIPWPESSPVPVMPMDIPSIPGGPRPMTPIRVPILIP